MLSIDAPPALPAHAVTLLLSYISSFDRHLPPHLLSTPLRQRHTFLTLGDSLDTSEDVATYLCWPSQSNDEKRVAGLLNALPSAEAFDPLIAFDTKYSFDGDATYAHASVPVTVQTNDAPSGLRLIFRWEASHADGVVQGHGGHATNIDNWKYHDAKPMPFPSNLYNSPHDACNPPPNPDPAQRSIPNVTNGKGGEAGYGSDDDDYWDSYGNSNSDDEGEPHESQSNGIPRSMSKISDDAKAEDAYWSQYASVHGTADSTRPSPLPPKRKLHDPNQPLPSSDSTGSSYFNRYQSSSAGQYTQFNHSTHSFDNDLDQRQLIFGGKLSPGEPCPEVLTRRLYAASPRPSRSPSPALPDVAEDAPALSGEVFQGNDNAEEEEYEVLGSPGTSEGRTLTPPGPAIIEQKAPPERSSKLGIEERAFGSTTNEVDAALINSIQGLYTLWALRQSPNHEVASSKEKFVSIVRDVLDQTA